MASAPGRDAILALMEQRGQPMARREIATALKVTGEDAGEILRRRLQAMVNAGQLIRNRRGAYGLVKRMDLLAGRVSGHPDGYGFVVLEDGEEDLYLSPRQMRGVLHGDRVLASVVGVDSRGRREGAVREVLQRAHEAIVGRYVEESGVGFVVPDNRRIAQDVLIPPGQAGKARPGDVVVAAIVGQPSTSQAPVGRITEVLGQASAPGMATEIAIRDFGLPHAWPGGIEAEAERFGTRVPERLYAGRQDLRDLPLVTIDGPDARDFDDAVYARRNRGGWRLVVAIADVASYVQPGSRLDEEALLRATSVYFPNRVIPMLPEVLSNGLCSLKPDQDRLCLACDMSVNDEGRVTRSRFVAGVMRSSARLTYGQVGRYLEQGQLERHGGERAITRNLDDLHALYRALRRARLKRGAIDFESSEVRFGFDAEGYVDALLPVQRNDAHRIIEECMILANVEAARFLLRHRLAAPFRVHAPPPALKVESLAQFLQGQGIRVTWRDHPQPRDFERIVEQARGRPDERLIMEVLLRSQSLAVYQPGNQGHFGLALEAYAHFTSPIRRYPDLLVHRAIHHQLARGKPTEFTYGAAQMEHLSQLCSERARRAEEAERDVDERLKCIYMERHVGEAFDGMVAGVTSFGLFVELDYGNVSGLLHVTGLPNDYYHFDPVAHRLTGERRRRVFQLADRLRVKVAAVNVAERKIDFELVE
ncbi:MAG: ribonuclease R [Xanthomonadales bacterium]|nr:ribonuclease R [Xanthomonadales bacterium]NIN60782.1 ribonuclease R [Xanthomonadales bacterium]NIN76144.1 ribonuclease R [Xanthomonadales bacterium]NIO15365.1 ribonuclease R [Xanthomonadales bacterium]NIP13175.1 ribonuclease R [Xanthomonadales bacterium]